MSPRSTPPSRDLPEAGKAVARRITIRDIAAKVGVHFTTVSMALRNNPRLPEETRSAIQKAAREMGYSPDPMLTALNAYRSAKLTPHYKATIAWINNWPRRDHLLEIAQFREYYEGASERARELGYVLEEFWMHEEGMTPAKLHRILKARNINTLLIAPQPLSNAPPEMNYREFSVVAFGYSIQPSVFHVVTSHHFHSMNIIMKNLVALGYRRIGLCYPADWDEKVENSCQGGLMLAALKWPELEIVPALLKTDAGDRELVAWMETHRPEAIISHLVTAEQLQSIGYRFPEEIGFVCLNLDRRNSFLSGIYQNDTLIGRAAIDLVVAMLHRGERGVPVTPVRTLVESVWVPGKTLRSPV
jgi:LacI family transcriptional regulator